MIRWRHRSMLVDVHTHTPTHRDAVPAGERQPNAHWRPDRVVDAAVSWADFMDAMHIVDRACVFGIRFKGGQMPAGREGAGVQWRGDVNADTAAFVRAYPDKLVGFLSVHPEEGDPVAEIERCVSDLGLKGIKLGPNYQGFDPLGAAALLVYEAAQRLGLPIVFHQGTSPMRTAPIRYAHPLVMDEIAMAYPELRIVMAHIGHPWHADTIAIIRKHPHVYADVSANFYRPWQQYQGLRLATEWNVLDKLVFGSDYPVATPRETLDGTLAVNRVIQGTGLPPVDVDALQAALERDTLALLGVST
jgi:predicted TIM-barrel fold metal-dependent hydrolase